MRESEYDRARREIRRLDSALNDHAMLAPTLEATPSNWLQVLQRRSLMARLAVQRMQVLDQPRPGR